MEPATGAEIAIRASESASRVNVRVKAEKERIDQLPLIVSQPHDASKQVSQAKNLKKEDSIAPEQSHTPASIARPSTAQQIESEPMRKKQKMEEKSLVRIPAFNAPASTSKVEVEPMRKKREEESVAPMRSHTPASIAGPSASQQASHQQQSNGGKKQQQRRRRGATSRGGSFFKNARNDRTHGGLGLLPRHANQGFQSSQELQPSVPSRRESRPEDRVHESSHDDESTGTCRQCARLDDEEYEKLQKLYHSFGCCEPLDDHEDQCERKKREKTVQRAIASV
ncbi:hypothetical protein BDZ45DRAFT_208251 [Acephala macrosclerotiorum]|nr:hypothetical protein BDZ45DRAFT_208251 [Acephala macrosclerotiorum]